MVFGLFDSPDPPAPIDYEGLIDRQAQANRIDVFGPYGNSVYSGDDRNILTITPSENQQTLINAKDALSIGEANRATQIQGNLPTGPVSFDGLPAMSAGVDLTALPSLSEGGITNKIAPAGHIQNSLGFNKLKPLSNSGDWSSERDQVIKSTFGRSLDLLAPQFEEMRTGTETMLADRGIPVGAEIYDREMDRMDRNQSNALTNAAYDAISAGGAEQSRMFGIDLSARQQGANELVSEGQFANAAQNQKFGQNLTSADFNNRAKGQLFNQSLQSRQQSMAEALANANLGNSARAQGVEETLMGRNQNLNELAQALGNQQIQMPAANGASQIDVTGPAQMQQSQNNAIYGAEMSNRNNNINAAATLASAFI